MLKTIGNSDEGLYITERESKLLLSQGIMAAMGWGWGICLKQPKTDKSQVWGAQTLETTAYSDVLTSTEVTELRKPSGIPQMTGNSPL